MKHHQYPPICVRMWTHKSHTKSSEVVHPDERIYVRMCSSNNRSCGSGSSSSTSTNRGSTSGSSSNSRSSKSISPWAAFELAFLITKMMLVLVVVVVVVVIHIQKLPVDL